MKNPILDLLLNYKGSINKQHYLTGLILLFVLVSFGVTQFSTLFIEQFIGRDLFSTETLAFYTIFRNTFSGLAPTFFPLHFLIFYSSIILTVKRARALQLNKLSSYSLALINYLFFSLLFNGLAIFSYVYNLYELEADNFLISTDVIRYSCYSVLILGVFANTFLMAKSDNQEAKISLTTIKGYQNLDQLRYTLFIGKMIFFNVIIMLIFLSLGLLFKKEFFHLLNKGILQGSILLVHVIFLGFYLYAVTKRFADTKYSSYYPIIVITLMITFSTLLVYMIQINNKASLYLLAIIPFWISLLSALQLIPFLLPSHRPSNDLAN